MGWIRPRPTSAFWGPHEVLWRPPTLGGTLRAVRLRRLLSLPLVAQLPRMGDSATVDRKEVAAAVWKAVIDGTVEEVRTCVDRAVAAGVALDDCRGGEVRVPCLDWRRYSAVAVWPYRPCVGSQDHGPALFYACATHGTPAVVRLLLDAGASPNAVNDVIHCLGCKKRRPHDLLTLRCCVEQDGESAVHAAAYFGFLDLTKTLLHAGGDAMLESKSGETPLDVAKARGRTRMVAAIEQVCACEPGCTR